MPFALFTYKKSSYHILILADKFCNIDNMSLLSFSKPKYNATFILNFYYLKDTSVLIKTANLT